MPPAYNETDTRSKLIDPALHTRGWTEAHIKREENAGGLYKVRGRWRREQKKADYLLRIPVEGQKEAVAVALMEAKKNTLPPLHGLEQGKLYASADRLNVPFVYSSNGYMFVEFDRTTGITSPPQPMDRFPTPEELQARYEAYMGFKLNTPAAQPLLTSYTGGDAVRRYYQDAAIRAALEKIAGGENRVLLALATGSGKTRIAIHLLKRIADAGQLRRVLFVCDRTELRDQALTHFQNVFGTDAQVVTSKNPRKNARILIATYQTLNVDTDGDTPDADASDGDANFFIQHYPENYFSHIIIDECHRSAWGKWRIILERNHNAVQVGLTATPRQLKVKTLTPGSEADDQITADNVNYFGEPVYEYDMSQGIADGYLAACEIQKGRVNLDDTGITKEQILALGAVDPFTGQPVTPEYIDALYQKTSYEERLLLPDRVLAMTQDLFRYLLETGGPEQKTIIFCQGDDHADRVAAAMNTLYAYWCKQNGHKVSDHYAFKCTSESSGNDMLPDFRSKSNDYFIATTVDLLTTGVDVPRVENVVFFRYIRSPISFYQMVGRGTRLFPETGKLAFRVYDYTGATDLFGEAFITPPPRTPVETGDMPDLVREDQDDYEIRAIEVVGFDVMISNAGRYIVVEREGKAMPVTVEEYKQEVAARLVAQAPDLGTFRTLWIDPDARRTLLRALPSDGQSALLIRELEHMTDYDLFDVLADLGYGMAPRTYDERADAFTYKHTTWLNAMPPQASATIRALAAQFKEGGTEELESQYIWRVPTVSEAGGLAALQALGDPAHILQDTKARMFAA